MCFSEAFLLLGQMSSTSNGDSDTSAGTATPALSSEQTSSSLPESVFPSSGLPATTLASSGSTSVTGESPAGATSSTAMTQLEIESDTRSPVQHSPASPPATPTSSSPAASIAPTTGGQGGDGASAGLAAGVVVGVLLVVVVVVVVVAAIVLAVFSVRRRRKYDLSCNGTYEVPPDTHIGKFVSFCIYPASTNL